MKQTVGYRLEFSENGEAADYPRIGWATPEAAHTWTDGTRSILALPTPENEDTYWLVIEAFPFTDSVKLPEQNIGITVNDIHIAKQMISETSSIICEVPWSVLARGGEWIILDFDIPDARSPFELSLGRDVRRLGIGVKSLEIISNSWANRIKSSSSLIGELQVESLSYEDLDIDAISPLLMIESLGGGEYFDEDEVPKAGQHKPSLLKWAVGPIACLLDALEAGLQGLMEPGTYDIYPQKGGRFTVIDNVYGMIFIETEQQHGFGLREFLEQKAWLLKKRLVGRLYDGSKYFAYNGARRLPDSVAQRLLRVIRRYNPDNCLVWVEQSDASRLPGALVQIEPGLIRSYVNDLGEIPESLWRSAIRSMAAAASER